MFLLTSTDIDECMMRKQDYKYKELYRCSDRGVCQNIPGNYSCICKKGKQDGKISECPTDLSNTIYLIIGKHSTSIHTVQFCLIQGQRQKKKLPRGSNSKNEILAGAR